MIMPFIRLVIIYIIVILAAVLFFNRDRVMGMMGYGYGQGRGEHHQGAEMGQGGEMGMDHVGHGNHDEGSEHQGETALATPMATGLDEGNFETQASAESEGGAEAPATAKERPIYPTADTAAIILPSATALTTVAPQPAATSEDQAVRKRIAEARAAYWSGNMAAAETHYSALVNDAPDNADIHGEFGNLLYGQRRYSEAAAQYFFAGQQLIAEGKMNQAMPLIGVLQNLAPEKAAQLRKLADQ